MSKRKYNKNKTQKNKISVPKRYVPSILSKKDTQKQKEQLKKSREGYKKGKYITREKMPSFKSKTSPHIKNAIKKYKLKTMKINKNMVEKTKCKRKTLKKIFNKGQGAYFSSGSRPNQTGHSWGYARLASAITGGKSSAVDYKLLEEGCSKNSPALKLAKKALVKYNNGKRRVPQVNL